MYSRNFSLGLLMTSSCATRPASRNSSIRTEAASELELTEQCIRDFVKATIPRLIKSSSSALLVEEMEVCSGRARVDLAVIGEYLIGIELKGPRDDVTRLPRQVEAYSQCFDRVVLVVHETLAQKARPLIPSWWGLVISLQRGDQLAYEFEKRPRPNPDLDLEALLSLLWRDEIDSLLADLLGSASKPRATKKTIRAELLSKVERAVLHRASLKKLRDRTNWRSLPIHA
jgi:hypothetical protein